MIVYCIECMYIGLCSLQLITRIFAVLFRLNAESRFTLMVVKQEAKAKALRSAGGRGCRGILGDVAAWREMGYTRGAIRMNLRALGYTSSRISQLMKLTSEPDVKEERSEEAPEEFVVARTIENDDLATGRQFSRRSSAVAQVASSLVREKRDLVRQRLRPAGPGRVHFKG